MENYPQPKTNPKPNRNLTWGQVSLGVIVGLSPNTKTNPDLDPNPNPNRGAIFLGGNCTDTIF